MQQKIKDILNNPALNRTYLATQLYPTLSAKAAFAKFNNKQHNKQRRNFTEQETEQVIQILAGLSEALNPGSPVSGKQEQKATNGGEKISEEKPERVRIDPKIFSVKN